LRVYVVKYRKQAGDYDYIDECASDAKYVYDVDADYYKKGAGTADETVSAADANLAKALADIAADIKSLGNYGAAKNVP
jgi:hypothetical protein